MVGWPVDLVLDVSDVAQTVAQDLAQITISTSGPMMAGLWSSVSCANWY